MGLRVVVMMMLAVAEPTLAATPRLERIDVVGDRAPAVRLHLSAAVSASAHRLPARDGAPARIYIDLRGAALGDGLLHVTPGSGSVLRVRAAQFGPTTARVVVELERSVPFSLRQEGETITLEPQAPAPTMAATEPPAPPAPPAPPLPAERSSAPAAPEAANPPADAAPHLDAAPRSVSFSLRQGDATITLEPQAPAPTVAAAEAPAPSVPPAPPLPSEGPSAPETANPPTGAASHLDAAPPSVSLALRQGDATIMLEPQAPAPTVAATEAPAPFAPPPSEAPPAPAATNPPVDAAPHLDPAPRSVPLALRQGDAAITPEPQAPAPTVAATEAPAPSAAPPSEAPSAPAATNPLAAAAPHLDAASRSLPLVFRQADATVTLEPQAPVPTVVATEAPAPSAPPAPPLPSEAPSAVAAPEATNPPADGTSQPPTSPWRPQSRGSQVKARTARPLVVHPPLIVLDAGHGGRDPGAAGIGGVLEKDIVLEVTQMVASRLATRLPVEVLLTRTGDSFVPIERRIAMPGDGATLFISVHANACSDPSAQGLEVFYGGGGVRTASTPGGSWRAALLGRCLDHALQSRVGGVRGEARPGSFGILVRNPAPSALIEIGYLTHPGEAARTQDRRYHELLADAVVEGVAAFLHASAPPL